jgi:hypothetical protein
MYEKKMKITSYSKYRNFYFYSTMFLKLNLLAIIVSAREKILLHGKISERKNLKFRVFIRFPHLILSCGILHSICRRYFEENENKNIQ